MEDALAPVFSVVNVTAQSLNPCCNGRCTRTWKFVRQGVCGKSVLILVVMEDALAL